MDRNNDNKNPERNPSKPMDSKKDVEQSNDPRTDEDFPGYPHYPAKEDMMDGRSGSSRVDTPVENIAKNRSDSSQDTRSLAGQDRERASNSMTPQPGLGDDDLDIRMGNDGDVTEDDLAGLRGNDDEIGTPQNVSNEDIGDDLDVPGADLDDSDEEIGEEDEENNYYSLGGDRHEAQEEDPQSGPTRGE